MKTFYAMVIGLMVLLSVIALGSISLPLFGDQESGRFQPLPPLNGTATPVVTHQAIADLATATPTPNADTGGVPNTPTPTPQPLSLGQGRAQLENLVGNLNDVLNSSLDTARNLGNQGAQAAYGQDYTNFLNSVDTDLHNRMRQAQKVESNNPSRYDNANNALQSALAAISTFNHGLLRDWVANKANDTQYNAAIDNIRNKIAAAQAAIDAL